jgi:hypothetical protein
MVSAALAVVGGVIALLTVRTVSKVTTSAAQPAFHPCGEPCQCQERPAAAA